jgi:sterol 22-desaturase
MASNTSFASPLANAQYPVDGSAIGGLISTLTQGLSGWTMALSLFLGFVLYDQCLGAAIRISFD